ncbi:MAG: HIT family protein [Patescibacteria group bacterium]
MTQNSNPNKETHDEDAIKADCIFCKIVSGEIPAVKIYEDDETLAFMDIQPNHKGHTLVIPKDHYENIYGLPPETAVRMMLTVQKLAIAVKNGVDADGINIAMNNESAAGQLVWHAHMHIIPRFNEDGGYLGKKYTYIGGEMEEIADKIQKEL